MSYLLEVWPEEATVLGVGGEDRWADRTTESLEAHARRCRAPLREDFADILDADALRARLTAEAARIERGDVLANLEMAGLPFAILQFQAFQAKTPADFAALARRAAAVPAALSQQEALLRRGLAEGRPADATLAAALIEGELPAMASSLDAMHAWGPGLGEAGAAAAAAYRAHAAFLAAEVVPAGASTFALGEDEVTRRLRAELGIDESPQSLIAAEEGQLPALYERLVRAAAALDPSIRDVPGALRQVSALWGETLDEDPLAAYATEVARAAVFAEERRLYALPAGYAVQIERLPEYRWGHVSSTNWPARDKAALLLVSPRPADHGRANLALLAVHEATPGHGAQSVAFAAHLDATSPRRLGALDEMAMALGQFGPMLSIEGWAVRSEEVMDEAGFFSPATRVLEAASAVIRSLRVIADLGLHAGRWTLDDAATAMSSGCGLPARWGRNQAIRYARIPLQACTYALGAAQIAKVEAEIRRREGASFDLARFHTTLAAAGAVQPARLLADDMRDRWPG